MELKFCSDHNVTYSQKRIQLQFPNAKLCEVLNAHIFHLSSLCGF